MDFLFQPIQVPVLGFIWFVAFLFNLWLLVYLCLKNPRPRPQAIQNGLVLIASMLMFGPVLWILLLIAYLFWGSDEP